MMRSSYGPGGFGAMMSGDWSRLRGGAWQTMTRQDWQRLVQRLLGTTANSNRGRGRLSPLALDRLADLLAERIAARLSGLTLAKPEPLVDAVEIARLHGKTRSWVYEHAGRARGRAARLRPPAPAWLLARARRGTA